MKPTLLEKVCIYLLKKGYTIKSLTRTCFDILARKETQILLIKILEDANSVSEEYTQEMQKISSYINGSVIIIAEKAGSKLEDNIVYSRFGIYTLNYNTFCSCVDNRFTFVKRDHAGLTARVIGNKLKQIREEECFSLASLSKRVGVSRRMIQKYEKGEADIGVNKALKLYDVFGGRIFDKIDIFSPLTERIHTIKTDDRIETEARLHQLFENKRANGEWFKLTQDDIDYIKAIQ